MSIDAQMFVRIKGEENWLTEEQVRRMAYELASTVGPDHFVFFWPGQFRSCPDGRHALEIIKPFVDEDQRMPDYVGKIFKWQDGDPIVAEPDEQFIDVHLRGRYWRPDYQVGNWPVIKSIAEWLEIRIPAGAVWYGGDSSGICIVPFDQAVRSEFSLHWAMDGNWPYVLEFGSGVTCPLCKAQLFERRGGSSEYDFLWCAGCDRKASRHKDGRVAWAKDFHHDHPIFNRETGEPEQRKRAF